MKLRLYILFFSFIALILVFTFSYSFLRSNVSDAFDDLAKAEQRQIHQVTQSFLLFQRKKLESILGLLGRDADLANTYILAQETSDQHLLQSKYNKIKSQSGFDFISIESTSSLDSDYSIRQQGGRIALITRAPLYLYDEKIGILRAGYFLDGKLLNDLREISAQPKIRLALKDGELVTEDLKTSIPLTDYRETLLPKMSLSLLGAFLVLYLLIYLFFDLGFMSGFKEILAQLRTSGQKLREGSIFDYNGSEHFIKELIDIDQSAVNLHRALLSYRDKLDRNAQEQQEVEKKVALADLASQVVHDIRSPVASLNIIIHSLSKVDPHEKDLLVRSLRRISEIADDLLKRRKQLKDEVQMRTEPILLAHVIESIVSETKIRVSENSITFSVKASKKDLVTFVMGEESTLKRVLANILTNAQEAIATNPGRITLSVEKANGKVKISIQDTGRGIPPEVISQVLEKGFSYKKEGGSGLGLYYVQENIKRWGAECEISSNPGVGTIVSLIFDEAPRPAWLLSNLPPLGHKTLAILDDDSAFLDAWKYCLDTKGQISCFNSVADFDSQMSKAGGNQFDLYFIDYDLGDSMTGTDIIERNNLQGKAILVTGRELDSGLLKKINSLGVSVLPKSIISEVI